MPRKTVRKARQERSKATVEAIVEGATRILSEKGWEALNTNAIAERAGVSVGSIYEYFPNKKAIVDVVFDRHLEAGEKLAASASGAIHSEKSTQEIIDLLVAGFVGLHCDDPKLHRTLSASMPLTEGQRARVDCLRTNVIAVVAAALEGRVLDPSVQSTLVIDAADALTHRWLVDDAGTPVSGEQMAAELARMLGLYLENS